ncbi:PIG-L deacetylase family protein, partial [candidate division KSB1 bacterium]
MNVLVIAADPDDEVLGCGGTIAKHVYNGDDVFCIYLGYGIASRYSDKMLKLIKENIEKATKTLGFKEYRFCE